MVGVRSSPRQQQRPPRAAGDGRDLPKEQKGRELAPRNASFQFL